MEVMIYFENTLIKPPKQLEVDGKENYGCIPVPKNVQYRKHRKKTNIGLFKFPDTDGKPELYKLWFKKTKAFL